MSYRNYIEKLALKKGSNIDIWGRCGPQYRSRIESMLGLSLAGTFSLFAEFIGNLSVNGLEILICGADDNWDCVSQTLNARAHSDKVPSSAIIIISSEVNFFYDTTSGSVLAFEDAPFEPFNSDVIYQFDSFEKFLEYMLDEDARPSRYAPFLEDQ